LDVKQQYPLKVYDEDGTLIGDYSADLFVDNRLIIELKAAKALADEHVARILERVPESIKPSCQAGELGAGSAAIARQGRHRRWPASSKQANEVLHRDVRLPQNGPQRAPVRFWRALSSAQDRATGWLVASALPASC
jgi:hypothetical protein